MRLTCTRTATMAERCDNVGRRVDVRRAVRRMAVSAEREQAQAATWQGSGRAGAMVRPSGSSSPVSSKTITPLHSRLQPCSGCAAITCAASRSGVLYGGQDGVCGHIGGLRSTTVTVLMLTSCSTMARVFRGNSVRLRTTN